MIQNSFKSILELLKTFPDEQSCIDHLVSVRWRFGVVSPFKPDSKVYKCKNNRYKCKESGKYFNVKTGTLFDNSKIPLQKWFLAIGLITAHKKGMSSTQLARDIDVTQKTDWFLLHRVRNCFDLNSEFQFVNEVEVDETYVGGKQGNRHESKKIANTQGRSTKVKTPVLGMVERKGAVAAKAVEDTKKKTLQPEVKKQVREYATVYTDGWHGYRGLGSNYDHKVINHSLGEYVKGDIQTNTIEGFWSLLKRGILGIYHSVSDKHLQKYVDEFSFRYNSRHLAEADRINLLLANAEVRTSYKSLVRAA